MTIQSSTSRQPYAGDGVSVTFEIPFPFFTNGDISISLTAPDGSVTPINNATISGAGDPTGGEFTLVTAPAVGYTVTVYLAPQILQLSHYITNAAFPAPTLEQNLDHGIQIDQYLQQQIAACIRADVSESAPSMLLPSVAARAGKVIGFNANGDVDFFTTIPTGTLSQNSVGSTLWPQTGPESRALLAPTNYFEKPYTAPRYGIVGDDTADDTIKLNALGAAVWQDDVSITFPEWMRMKTTDTVTFSSTRMVVCMEGKARIRYYGPKDRTVLVVGSATTSYAATRMRLSAEYVTLDNDFSNANFRAIQFQGTINGCTIELPYVRGCTANVEWYCNNDFGMAYNHIYCGLSYDAKYHFLVRGITSNGFWNENQVYGGNHQTTSGGGLQSTDTAYGTILTADPGGYTGHNNNVWHKPCYQLAQSGISVNRIPIWLNNAGGSNQFRSVRAESIYNEIMKITSDTVSVRMNSLDIGYMGEGAGNITAFITESDGGLSYGNRATLNGVPLSTTYTSGDLRAKAWAPDTGKISCEGMFFQSSGSGTETTTGTGKIGKDYIILHSSPMGCYLDTTYHKELRLVADTQTTRGGRVFFTAHDQYGAQITRARAVYFGGAQEDANYGGKRYFQSSDSTGSLDFRVDSDVASVKVFFANGTNPCNLRQFTVTGYATQLQANIVVVPTPANIGGGLFGGPFAAPPGQRLSTTDPTALGGGYTQRGVTVGNTAAAAGATSTGWVCTLGGWGAIAWGGSQTFFLNELRTNDTGKVYVCTVAGAGAGAGGPTGTGAGDIVDGAATWRYVPNPTGLNATWSALPNQNAS